MSLIIVVSIIVLAVACIFYEVSKRKCYASLPPGPANVILLGNIHYFIRQNRPYHEILTEIGKKYGDILTIWILNKPVIFLSSMRAIREVFHDHKEISDRPSTVLSTLIGGFGFEDYTPKTKVIRKAVMQSIRSFWNAPKAEAKVVKVIEDVVDEIVSRTEETKKPIQMNEYIVKIIYNMTLTLLFGFDKKFALDNAEFLKLCKSEQTADDFLRASQLYDGFPFLRHLGLHNLSAGFKRIRENVNRSKSYLKFRYEDINAPTRNEDEGEGECFASGLTKRLKAANEPANGDGQSIKQGIQFAEEDIADTLYPMFFGATSTTIKNFSWLLLEMVLHPEIQEKCYQQLMEVTRGRPVTQSDRSRLPYIEACIMEVLRFRPAAVFTLPRISHSAIIIRTHKIPAGVSVIMNLWGAQHDVNIVKDAHHFNPENFLDDKGQFSRPQDLFPFGAGRRICPGEAQGKLSMFFAFATILQRLRFDRVEEYEIDLAPDPSRLPLLAPKKYYVNIVERK